MIFSKKTFLLVAILTVIVALICFKLLQRPSRSNANAASESSLAESKFDAKSTTAPRIRENWLDLVNKSLLQGSGSDFAKKMQRANLGALEQISAAILSAHQDQPGRTIAWLEELSLELAVLDAHNRAALLLEFLSPFEETADITSKVFSDWIQKDAAGTYHFFKDLSADDAISSWQLEVVAELFQGPHLELFDTYQTWIEQSDLNLKGSLVEAVVPHLLPENVDSVTEIILENLEHERQFGFAFSRLVKVRSPEDPAQHLEWLSQLGLPRSQIGTQVAAFGVAISHIARNDIDAVTELISQENFLPTYFPGSQEELVDENGNWSGDARWFFDEVLTHFIEEIRDTDPELARNSVESFFDPVRREESRLSFQEEEDPIQKEDDSTE